MLKKIAEKSTESKTAPPAKAVTTATAPPAEAVTAPVNLKDRMLYNLVNQLVVVLRKLN